MTAVYSGYIKALSYFSWTFERRSSSLVLNLTSKTQMKKQTRHQNIHHHQTICYKHLWIFSEVFQSKASLVVYLHEGNKRIFLAKTTERFLSWNNITKTIYYQIPTRTLKNIAKELPKYQMILPYFSSGWFGKFSLPVQNAGNVIIVENLRGPKFLSPKLPYFSSDDITILIFRTIW